MGTRIDRIFASKQNLLKNCKGFLNEKPWINLLGDFEYIQSSFIKRRGMAVSTQLDNVDVRLFPDELLAGTFLETWTPVIETTYEERRQHARHIVGDGRRNEYIDDQGLKHIEITSLSDAELKSPFSVDFRWGHTCAGYKRILQVGYRQIAAEAEENIEKMHQSGKTEQEKIDFWEAVILSTSAVCRLSERYANELEKQALEEVPKRAQEMQKLARIMRRVPAEPAETFYEALQSVWFSWMVNLRYNWNDIGRLDQYLYPFYKRDLETGIITPEEAQELMDCFFLKCFEHYIALPENSGLHPSLMLGGLNADGIDGTNDVTFMCLLSCEKFAFPTPKVSVRVNDQTPSAIYEIATRMMLKGISQPDFYADDSFIPAYLRLGVPVEDAVEYAQSVCEEVSLAGLSEDCTNDGIHCDLHVLLDNAMKRVASGESADSFDAFMQIMDNEIRNCVICAAQYHDLQAMEMAYFVPQPLHSASIVGCIESGKDILAGGAKYNNTGTLLSGLATATDGLYAIRKLVYEDKRLTMKEFYAILEDNYQGQEFLRLEILNKFPKFGNDNDEVDSIAVRLFDIWVDEVEKHTNCRGGRYKVGAWASGHRNDYMATPDGRRKGDAFATNISPTPGRETKGVTSVIRSATKINMKIAAGGSMLDVAMNPSCLRGENGPEILRQLVRTYGDLGGGALQFNIIDAAVLKAAQADPIRYRNLMVRVWGYNDYFVSLPKERQNHILSRTIHCN